MILMTILLNVHVEWRKKIRLLDSKNGIKSLISLLLETKTNDQTHFFVSF